MKNTKKTIEFETYKDLTDDYSIANMTKKEPCCVNFLSYRRYKVKIELIDEPKKILIDRLKNLLEKEKGFNRRSTIKREIKILEYARENQN